MIKFIDRLLNRFTMYRVVLYGLMIMAAFAVLFGFLGWISFGGWQLLLSMLVLVVSCYFSNYIFALILKASRNTESALITACILFFVLAPPVTAVEAGQLALTGVIAMLSKYVLAIGKKHIFNPAALGAFVMGLFGVGVAIWWVATPFLLPFTIIIGLCIVRKIRRFSLFLPFIATGIVTILIVFWSSNPNIASLLWTILASWPLVFFGTVMLTEPLTSPPTRNFQIIYGALVGILFGLPFQLGPVYSTPELALLLGNLFAYIVSPKWKLRLQLKEIHKLAGSIYEVVFSKSRQVAFQPGHYLEWTLPHVHPDDRGNRRYFTISSSPTEKDIRLTVKTALKSSTFKQQLISMKSDETMWASQLGGDFILPKDPAKKLVFIAGGIGVTPFRSMIKYLVDRNEKRDIALFYSIGNAEEFVFQDIWKEGEKIGLKTVPILTMAKVIPENWQGKTGFLTGELLEAEVPDYKERSFYLSGPNVMVTSYRKLLLSLKIHRTRIRTDYFPGF